MQTTKEIFLGKRTRYYHSEMDGYALKKGKKYSELGKNIVIFICTYDCFGENRSIYTFRNTCIENKKLYLDDDIQTIILNANGSRKNVDNKLSVVLDYIKTGQATDEYTKDIEKSVKALNNDDDWRTKYMTFEMKMDEKYNAGIVDGKQNLLITMVKDGEITVDIAAKHLNIAPEEFEEKMNQQS